MGPVSQAGAMPNSSLSLSEGLLEDQGDIVRHAHFYGKVIALLPVVIGFGFVMFLCRDGGQQIGEHAIKMTLALPTATGNRITGSSAPSSATFINKVRASHSLRPARVPRYMPPVRSYGEFTGPGGSSWMPDFEEEEKLPDLPKKLGLVHNAYRNHYIGFVRKDIDAIMDDYTEESTVTVYNFQDQRMTVAKGLDEIEKCFNLILKNIFNARDLDIQDQKLKEASASEPGIAYTIWYISQSGYNDVSSTMIFDSDGKIVEHTIAMDFKKKELFPTPPEGEPALVTPNGSGPVHDAWQNHFSAFGVQDIDKILKDYTDNSSITVYNCDMGQQNEYQGLNGVKECFADLFAKLYDTSNLHAPVQIVKEGSDGGHGKVFLAWTAVASGFEFATDTFIFDAAGKILRQNVVMRYSDPREEQLWAKDIDIV